MATLNGDAVAPHCSSDFVGYQALVVATHRPYYLQTTNPNAILGSFSTILKH